MGYRKEICPLNHGPIEGLMCASPTSLTFVLCKFLEVKRNLTSASRSPLWYSFLLPPAIHTVSVMRYPGSIGSGCKPWNLLAKTWALKLGSWAQTWLCPSLAMWLSLHLLSHNLFLWRWNEGCREVGTTHQTVVTCCWQMILWWNRTALLLHWSLTESALEAAFLPFKIWQEAGSAGVT